MDAERVGGEQAVLARVPPGRVVDIVGVIEDRDRACVFGHLTPVGDPHSSLAPAVAVRMAGAVDAVPRGNATLDAQAGREAHGEGAFLRVAEQQVVIRGTEHDVKIDRAPLFGCGEAHGAALYTDQVAVQGAPLVAADDQCGASPVVADHVKTSVADGRLRGVPEVVSVDGAMGEPHGAVVGMIAALAGELLHWEPTRDRDSAGSEQGVEERSERVVVVVAAKEVLPFAYDERPLLEGCGHVSCNCVRGEGVDRERGKQQVEGGAERRHQVELRDEAQWSGGLRYHLPRKASPPHERALSTQHPFIPRDRLDRHGRLQQYRKR